MGIYLVPQRKEDERKINGANAPFQDGGIDMVKAMNPGEFVGHSIVFNLDDARDRGLINQATGNEEELRLSYQKTKKALTDPGTTGQITLCWGDLVPHPDFSFCLIAENASVRVSYQDPAKPRKTTATPAAEPKAEAAPKTPATPFHLTGMNSGLFIGNSIAFHGGTGTIQKVNIPVGKGTATVSWEGGSVSFPLKSMTKGPKDNSAVVTVDGVEYTLHHNRPSLSFSRPPMPLALNATPRPAVAQTPRISIPPTPSVPPGKVPPTKG